MAICFLSVLKYCFLFFIAILINAFTNGFLSAIYLDRRIFLFCFWAIVIIFFIIDIVRYTTKERIDLYNSLFKQSSFNKIPTWLIFMQPMILILLAILLNEIIKKLLSGAILFEES